MIRVDTASPVPVYEQIRQQVTTMIGTGTLRPGAQLPTIRQLALDLGVAKATVNKAYESMLRDGLIESAGRKGTVVSKAPQRLDNRDRALRLRQAADEYALAVHMLDADIATAHRYLDMAHRKLEAGNQ
jgi:GntR family transcriptional regulator